MRLLVACVVGLGLGFSSAWADPVPLADFCQAVGPSCDQVVPIEVKPLSATPETGLPCAGSPDAALPNEAKEAILSAHIDHCNKPFSPEFWDQPEMTPDIPADELAAMHAMDKMDTPRLAKTYGEDRAYLYLHRFQKPKGFEPENPTHVSMLHAILNSSFRVEHPAEVSMAMAAIAAENPRIVQRLAALDPSLAEISPVVQKPLKKPDGCSTARERIEIFNKLSGEVKNLAKGNAAKMKLDDWKWLGATAALFRSLPTQKEARKLGLRLEELWTVRDTIMGTIPKRRVPVTPNVPQEQPEVVAAIETPPELATSETAPTYRWVTSSRAEVEVNNILGIKASAAGCTRRSCH